MNNLENKLIDVDLDPQFDVSYSGLCLKENEDFIMILNFNEEKGSFDGFSLINQDVVDQYQLWDEEDLEEIKKDNREEECSKIDLNNFQNIEGALTSLKGELIALCDAEDHESFFAGKVLNVDESSVNIKLIDEDSNWQEEECFGFHEISYVGFGTSYEREVLERAK